VVNDFRYSTTEPAESIIASSMTESCIKQITGRLNDLVRMLDNEIDPTERRELLRQFRQLLDQADKLNAEGSSFRESRTISEQI
jgi:hypothetical protein